MNGSAKTLQIFLPTGDPRGIRIAEITTRIVRVFEVPRSLLSDFLKMPESEQVAVYFLVGDEGDGTDPKVYVGQTGDLRTRLPEHNKNKDFWQRALVLISLTDNLTQTHGLFLESFCLQRVKAAGRFQTDNNNSGNRPHAPAPLEAECHEIFETASTLLATLGYPMFDAVAKPAVAKKNDEVFYCNASGIASSGLYTAEGFVVLKGSVGRLASVPSIAHTSDGRFREKLIESGVLKAVGETVVLDKDHLFKSPSAAAIALLGRTANGWKEWKAKDGRTLDEVKRSGPVNQP